jgi:hypothetical protein
MGEHVRAGDLDISASPPGARAALELVERDLDDELRPHVEVCASRSVSSFSRCASARHQFAGTASTSRSA